MEWIEMFIVEGSALVLFAYLFEKFAFWALEY